MENKQTAEWQNRIQQGAETIAAGMLSGNNNLVELTISGTNTYNSDVWARKIARAAVAISRQIALISNGIED